MAQIKDDENNKIRILSVKWNDNLVGYLMKDYGVGYLFKYDKKSVREARSKGFIVIPGLSNINKTYVSQDLFQIFKARIPSKQRRDLPEILKNLGIKASGPENREFDDFEYLAKTHGKSMTDFLSVDEDVNLKNKKINTTNIIQTNFQAHRERDY